MMRSKWMFALIPAVLSGAPSLRADRAPDAGEVPDRAALEARIRELRAEIDARKRAPGAGISAAPISTQAVGDLGLRWSASPIAPEVAAELTELLAKEDGAAAYRLVARFLTSGPEGYGKLCDLFEHLEQEDEKGLRFAGTYDLNFGHVHHAMLHEKELAEFAHFYLNATRDRVRLIFRDRLYEFLPVFLEFHRGRFPDLERALQLDLTRQFADPSFDPSRAFAALERLSSQPPLHQIERYLQSASTLQQFQGVFSYLLRLDTRDALGVLVRFVDYRDRMNQVKYEIEVALTTIVRMEVPEAKLALAHFFEQQSPRLLEPLLIAYFAVEREIEHVDTILAFLNGPSPFKPKRRLILQLAATNPRIVEHLAGRLAEISDGEARSIVESQAQRIPRGAGAGATEAESSENESSEAETPGTDSAGDGTPPSPVPRADTP